MTGILAVAVVMDTVVAEVILVIQYFIVGQIKEVVTEEEMNTKD
jgi:hypothetical protein